MKLITAIIKPFQLDDVREACPEMVFRVSLLQKVKGFGRQKGTPTVSWADTWWISAQVKVEVAIGEKKKKKWNLNGQVIESITKPPTLEKSVTAKFS